MPRYGNNNPSHGYLFINHIKHWLAIGFVLLALTLAVFMFIATNAVKRDCGQPYHGRVNLLGWWLDVDMGSTKPGCAQSR